MYTASVFETTTNHPKNTGKTRIHISAPSDTRTPHNKQERPKSQKPCKTTKKNKHKPANQQTNNKQTTPSKQDNNQQKHQQKTQPAKQPQQEHNQQTKQETQQASRQADRKKHMTSMRKENTNNPP